MDFKKIGIGIDKIDIINIILTKSLMTRILHGRSHHSCVFDIWTTP